MQYFVGMKHALIAALFAALAPADVPSANAAAAQETRTVLADGHRVAFRVLGSGRPAIVLISGLGDGMATFADVAGALAKTNTVILYDRAGYGGSEPQSGPRDAAAAERELSAVLAQSGATGPFVLAGHSLGGLYAEYFAAKHSDQVAGLILEDSRPADFTRRCSAAIGAGACLPPAWLTWMMAKGARGEAAALERTVAQVEEAAPLKGKPVLVLSRPGVQAGVTFDTLWTQAQNDLAARYPGSRHLTAQGGGHYIHRDQGAWFVNAVRTFLAEIR